MGNAQFGLDADFPILPPGVYYWSVQAVDTAFASSAFATEHSFGVCAPLVTSSSASDLVAVGSNACVMLRGTVNPGQRHATAWFEWGATTNFDHTTPAIQLGAAGVDLPVSHWLCGLAAGTNYHARLVATNSLGTSVGADVLISTQPPNLALNPGFESGTTGWSGFGWASIRTATELSHSGSFSVFFSIGPTHGAAWQSRCSAFCSQTVPTRSAPGCGWPRSPTGTWS
jgi:hypothetical protein